MRCARCGRRVSYYLTEGGHYLAHVIPFAFHRAILIPASYTPTGEEQR